LAAPAPLWLLDEPTVSLDAESAAALTRTLTRHLGEGGMAVIATHIDMPLPGAGALDLDRAAALDIADVLQ